MSNFSIKSKTKKWLGKVRVLRAVIFFFIPLVFIIFTYSHVMKKIIEHFKRQKKMNRPGESAKERRILDSDLKF